jgi:hypothetical protein
LEIHSIHLVIESRDIAALRSFLAKSSSDIEKIEVGIFLLE